MSGPLGIMPFMPPAVEPPVLAFLQTSEDTVDRSSYSFGSVNFGVEAADREIIAALAWKGSGAQRTLDSASIGGQSADIHVTASDGSRSAAIIAANVPSGGSGTVSLNFSGTCVFAIFGLYRATGLKSRTPEDTDFDTDFATGDPVSMALNILSGGCAIGTMVNHRENSSINTTGLNEDDDQNAEANDRWATASDSLMDAETGRQIEFESQSAFSATGVGVCASWR